MAWFGKLHIREGSMEAVRAEHCKPRRVLETSQSLLVAPRGIHRAAATELPALSSFCSWLFPFLFLSPSQPTCLFVPTSPPHSPGSSGAALTVGTHCHRAPEAARAALHLYKPCTGALGSGEYQRLHSKQYFPSV